MYIADIFLLLVFGDILEIVCPPPSPSPASVKVPFQGNKYRKKHLLLKFYDFNEKLTNCTDVITSCSIRRVGRR